MDADAFRAAGYVLEIKNGDEGKETITTGTNKYECKCRKMTVIVKLPAKMVEVKYEYKLWTSESVPLGGLVKMEMSFGDTTRNIVLDDSGKDK